MGLREIGFEDEAWKELVQDRVQWRILYFGGFGFFRFYYQGFNGTHFNIQCTNTVTIVQLPFLKKLL